MPAPFDLTLDGLRRRTSEKWRRYPADVLPLWVAEMDVQQAAPVVEAVQRAVADGDTGYASPQGYDVVVMSPPVYPPFALTARTLSRRLAYDPSGRSRGDPRRLGSAPRPTSR